MKPILWFCHVHFCIPRLPSMCFSFEMRAKLGKNWTQRPLQTYEIISWNFFITPCRLLLQFWSSSWYNIENKFGKPDVWYFIFIILAGESSKIPLFRFLRIPVKYRETQFSRVWHLRLGKRGDRKMSVNDGYNEYIGTG